MEPTEEGDENVRDRWKQSENALRAKKRKEV